MTRLSNTATTTATATNKLCNCNVFLFILLVPIHHMINLQTPTLRRFEVYVVNLPFREAKKKVQNLSPSLTSLSRITLHQLCGTNYHVGPSKIIAPYSTPQSSDGYKKTVYSPRKSWRFALLLALYKVTKPYPCLPAAGIPVNCVSPLLYIQYSYALRRGLLKRLDAFSTCLYPGLIIQLWLPPTSALRCVGKERRTDFRPEREPDPWLTLT